MSGHRIARFPSPPPRHTLADIRRFADPEGRVAVGTDDTTPDGYFYAVASVFGAVRTYLLRGRPDDDDAPIVGAIATGAAYQGHKLLGGTRLRGHSGTAADAFRLIAAADTEEARRG